MTYPKEVTVSTEILSQDVDDETVLLDIKAESYFGLDKVGTRIWQLLQACSDPRKIHNAIISEFEVSSEQLHEDLNRFLKDLSNEGLVKLRY